MRSAEYNNGKREAIRWAITWLHQRALSMNDPHAKAVLNTAAFNMGVDAKQSISLNSMPQPQWITDYEKMLMSEGGPADGQPAEN